MVQHPVTENVRAAADPPQDDESRRFLSGRTVLFIVSALAVALVSAWLIMVDNRSAPLRGEDLQVYRAGAKAVLHGTPIYDATATRFHLPFTYPPFSAIVMVPLAFGKLALSHLLWAAVGVLCVYGVMWLVLEMMGVRSATTRAALSGLGTLVFTWIPPVQYMLKTGQVSALLMLLVVYDLARLKGRRAHGIGIGLAMSLKLVPGIFLVYLLLARRFRAAAVVVGTFLATVAVGFAVLPGASAKYWTKGFVDVSRQNVIPDPTDQSLRGFAMRLMHTADHSILVWLLGAVVVLAAGVPIVKLALDRGDESLAMIATAVVGLLVSTVSWESQWVWIVPLLLYAVDLVWRTHSVSGAVALAFLTVAFSCRPYIWWIPIGADMTKLHGMKLLYASWYVMFTVLALATTLVWLVRNRSSATHGELQST
jgi:alpha-1,2-mannosyltransferase